jgi:hypothetical protein
MTDTTATAPAPTSATWTRWLYPALAITGIAVGIFIVVAGVYLLFFAHSGCCGSMNAAKDDCCASMKDMKDMKMPMGQMPSMPSMSPTPSMSPMPNTPAPTPTR